MTTAPVDGMKDTNLCLQASQTFFPYPSLNEVVSSLGLKEQG